MGSDPATRAYAERRTAEGKSKKEIIRCLKRYVAREPPLGRDRIAGVSWQRKVGPQPGRPASIQRDLNCRGRKDLIVCQRGIGPAAEVAAGLDPGSGTGPGGPPAQSAARGQYAGPRTGKALG